MALIHDTARFDAGLAGRIVLALNTLREANRPFPLSQVDQTRRELMALSNRELNDLGLNRSMITEVARSASHGR